MLVLFTDTDTDITPEQAKEYGYHLISMPYAVDGKATYPYVDFEKFDGHAFYNMLREGTLPSTSAISSGQYREYFEPHFKNGDDILYVHFSAAMTMTFNEMDIALAELRKEYPERKFYSIDTKGITTLSYNIVLEIGDMYKAGKSVDEILEWAKNEVDHFTVYFFADDLKFFKRSGRVSGLAATMGTLIGVRPIIYMNDEGKMVSVGKERGRANAMDRLVNMVEQLGDHIEDHRIVIGHTDAPELAEEVRNSLIAKFGNHLRIETQIVNPTAGSHCGPNAVGVCFHAIHR
ncbi:MAG: DegV family protein [Clostridia bacterium]|nr:DegV family protein [Clostridia bacterium]